jgi:hypothetical protein
LVDAVYDWSRFNSLPRGYDWIRAELGQDPAIASEIARVAMRYGNISTLRRLGRQLERAGAAPTVLGSLESRLSPSSALIPWVPTLPPATNDDRGVLLRQPGGGIDTAGRGHKTQFWRVHVVSSTMDVARPNYRFVPGGFAREIHFICLRVVAVARESSPGRR